MSDSIYREDAIRTVCECECYSGDNPCEEGKGCYAVNELRKLSSADRPQGEWIDSQGRPMRLYESYSANCSACGEWSEYLTEYCPHCGARMKGADDE